MGTNRGGATAWLYRHRGLVPVIPILVALVWADPRPGRVGVGILLMGIGESIRLWGAAHLGSTARSSTPRAGKLVTTGPYARTRHPLYWGNFCLTLGFVIASGAFWPLFPVLAAIGFLLLYARYASAEEGTLAAAFPDAHAAWQRVVPAVLWRVRPARVAPEGETGAPSWSRALRVEAGSLHAEFWLLVVLRLRASWGG